MLHYRIFVLILTLSLTLSIFSCARRSTEMLSQPVHVDKLDKKLTKAFEKGKAEDAREAIAEALRTQPQNGYLHLLNGLTYQIEDNSVQSLTLAKVGYDAAAKFSPGHYWSHYLDGAAAFELGEYTNSADLFSQAIWDNPDRPEAYLGLAGAAYYMGDLEVARLAAEKALSLSPEDPIAYRAAAYAHAASGNHEKVAKILARAENVPFAGYEMEIHKSRLTQLLRTASLSLAQVNLGTDSSDSSSDIPEQAELGDVILDSNQVEQTGSGSQNAEQVMIEVTLLLNQSANIKNTGINLLDGLTAQFGMGQTYTRTIEESDGDKRDRTGTGAFDRSRGTDNLPGNFTQTLTNGFADASNWSKNEVTSKVFTAGLKIPDITYSLNLFNTKSDHYRVVARPSLVAYLNETSEFFIGRQVTVGVSGVNLGTLQPVDVGIKIKVTPNELTDTYTRCQVEIERSFFTGEASGTFDQSLTTFRQTVSGTAEVDYGKTLILSGLYESVDFGNSSKTPWIGDIPGVDTFFNARSRNQRTDVALVLITPRRPGAIDTNAGEFRSETLASLLRLWNELIDPTSNMDAMLIAVERRGKKSVYFQPKAGDLKLQPVASPSILEPAIRETLAQLR